MLLEGNYGPLLDFLSVMKVHQWVLELATYRNRNPRRLAAAAASEALRA